MVKPEKFSNLHIVNHFIVPLRTKKCTIIFHGNKFHKGTPQYPKKEGKSLLEYSIF